MTTIRALRILPPFAIGRLGAGTPLDSYRIEVDEQAPLDWRTIVPDTTFEVDPATGAITRDFTPDEIEFTEKVNAIAEADSTRELVQLAMAAIGSAPVPMAAIPAHQASLHD